MTNRTRKPKNQRANTEDTRVKWKERPGEVREWAGMLTLNDHDGTKDEVFSRTVG